MFDIDNGWVQRLEAAVVPTNSAKRGWLVAEHRTIDPAFMEPTLKVLQGDPTTARVIVVAAPGAVGKSTLARAISVRSSAVLVDLATTEPLGGNFFVGGVANAFGPQALPDLYAGKIALVVDALDEAQLDAGDDGFSAGLLDLAAIVQAPGVLPATILGRATAAETAWLILIDAGVDACLLMIDFFDAEQATEYLRRRLPALAATREATKRAFERHGANYVDLAIAVHEKLTTTAGDQDPRFSGYAPVLDAICAYSLDEKDLNPSARLANLAFNGAIGLVERIAKSILEREQLKLTNKIEGAPPGVDLLELYTPAEQLCRLAANLFKCDLPAGPHIADPMFRQTYEDKVAEFSPQHPFLSASGGASSAAFAAFVLVWGITTGAAREEARRALAKVPTMGAGLFFELYMSWLKEENHNDNNPRRLDLADVGPLYASFAGQAARGEQPQLEIAGEPHSELIDVSFEMIPSAERPNAEIRLYGPYDCSTNAVLDFHGLVGGLDISAPISVIVGDGRNVGITAPVQIDVDTLEIDGRDLRVIKSALTMEPIGSAVVLMARDADVSRVDRIVTHGATLAVTFPGAQAYPWSDYYVAREPAPNEQIAVLRRRARRVLTSFRSHSKGALVRLADKINHARMMKEGSEGRRLLERLQADGILSPFDSGKFYQLHSDRLAVSFGMDYQAIQNQHWSDEADAYLSSL
jgi:hypothetical protein